MNRSEQQLLIGFGVGLLVFGWGLTSWFQARNYQPLAPVQSPVRQFSYQKPEPSPKFAQYQALTSGKMYFGSSSVTASNLPPIIFQSKLVVWGIISGKPSNAVIGVDPESNADTWIIKPGDMMLDERVVGIGANFVLVRNRTGEGRVYLK